MKNQIIYTKVDEAPELATASLLPILKAFLKHMNIEIHQKDISLSGRILSQFSHQLQTHQKRNDDLNDLAKAVQDPQANIIKLPNISASIPQLKDAIKELQGQGYAIASYPDAPQNEEEEHIKAIYDRIKGSAVNPVLREGNSDRRAPQAVKAYAQNNPHHMGEWTSSSQTHVATMTKGDFYSNEQAVLVQNNQAGQARISFHPHHAPQESSIDKNVDLEEKDIIDASFMSVAQLRQFIQEQCADAKQKNILFSLHLKATMMKVSDPVIFGQALSVFFAPLFEKYAQQFQDLNINPNDGLVALESKIKTLDKALQQKIKDDLDEIIKNQPDLYMVNSDEGITNFHVPSDVIIDASMPAVIRAGGKAWDHQGQTRDVKCVIPDQCYAGVYDQTISFCKEHGAFDPKTMGSISNVGLMAKKAQEYGSHPYTFVAPNKGHFKITSQNGQVLMEHQVEKGDIWRMCHVKDVAITNWVELALTRCERTQKPGVFWLNESRPHDRLLIKKVRHLLAQKPNNPLIDIMAPRQATAFSLERAKKGQDTISITGNVLRDYLTDLFPILELGTSAKMLSIVPLMKGGGLFETGAGGSAPKIVQQFLNQGHLRWDSLGEFCALGACLDHLSHTTNNPNIFILSQTLNRAIEDILNEKKSPKPTVGDLDNRGSHYYLARYWSQALAQQDQQDQLKKIFEPLCQNLIKNEEKILQEIQKTQGQKIDIQGYYAPNQNAVDAAMRPSRCLNQIIESLDHI